VSLNREDLSGPAQAFLASRELTTAPLALQRALLAALTGEYESADQIPADARALLEREQLLDYGLSNYAPGAEGLTLEAYITRAEEAAFAEQE
jgi:hypothetical protein